MSYVLAVLDDGAAARPVLDAALRLGALIEQRVEAIHIVEADPQATVALAEQRGVRLRAESGRVVPALVDALLDPDVSAGVIGARRLPGGRRPVGTIARSVLHEVHKPMLVVPPEGGSTFDGPFRRALVPLEGSPDGAVAVSEWLGPTTGCTLLALHVFTPDTVPAALDRSDRDLRMWTDELVTRFCPAATDVAVVTGPVGRAVAELGRARDCDLVVLTWSGNLDPGHARTALDIISAAELPVLLLPRPAPA